MVGNSIRLQVIPQQSTQNAANLPLQTCEKNRRTFFAVQQNFASLGSFVKAPVPVESTIPCLHHEL